MTKMSAGMFAAVVAMAVVLASSADGFEELTLTLHGSGTTNPSRLLWLTDSLVTARSKVPIHATYRAVGSSAGRSEFVNNLNDYAASELPLSPSQSSDVASDGDVALHFPLHIGAIGVFVNLPTGSSIAPGAAVNLTAAAAAGIFSRTITTWDDAAIVGVNPGLTVPAGAAITVVHRVFGSSSTSLLAEFLNAAAPSQWLVRSSGGDAVAAVLDWPADTVGVEGSSQMAAKVGSTPGSIGYMDAGHGIDAGLAEVALQNAAGLFLTSAKADIAAAASVAPLPASSADAWDSVTLVNQPGTTTWPIVSFTYLLLRQNQTRGDTSGDVVYGQHRQQPDSGALLKAYAEFLFSTEGQELAAKFGFTKLPQTVIDLNAAGLATIRLHPDVPVFAFEESTDTVNGAKERTISVKRKSYELVALDDHDAQLTAAAASIDALTTKVAALEASASSGSGTAAMASSSGSSSDDSTTANVALAVAAIAIIFALAAGIVAALTLRKLSELRAVIDAVNDSLVPGKRSNKASHKYVKNELSRSASSVYSDVELRNVNV
ncbi:ATP-binding cassette superfamily protein [Thecamonas trahens ATCC 50062]|uniref:ATP-binding cassette superfamily protein n=1 Tax=Thecamonas trahens ATCC 50062 TaxID=461836 RepID=A0A0L0DST7_THETB|nr:ATP-binding cassette superfamily protein [Thecamonas trahens ATCC 50062]KNC55071.1 ATP-binding cassette superfamily protein [Thecamonas trahens ATCC 50062]|eukprot:XP_013753374.1 ATP-binding cassette superfamily protein [Thecamonas trahens ATCC 50062]